MKLLFLLFICLSATVTHAQEEGSFVDPNIVLQEKFQGWGTSLAWWADMVGGMEPDVIEHVTDALFSPSKLNLNIVRYVIGGTTPDNYTCGEYRDGAATPSYKDGPDQPYDWNRDLKQRKILQLAKEKGANIFEAFSNSPPQWLTISGCSKGNVGSPPLHNNFNADNAPYFADYATEVIKHFHEELNITFTTFSPFNEPYGLHGIGGWMGSLSQQEGCNMNRVTMVTVIENVYESLQAKNLDFVKIAVSDETQVNTQIQTYDFFVDAGVGDMFRQVNVHGYWEDFELSRKDRLSLKCNKQGHELWMDEMGWGGTPPDNMEQGLHIATRVLSDLRNMLPSAWVYWQVVEGGGGWGLMEVPYDNSSTVNYNSGYYALEQFSNHIRKGYKLIYTSDVHTIAAINEQDQKLVIVTVNAEETERSHEFDLSLVESLGTPELFRTSTTEQHLNLPPPSISAGNKVAIQLPPQSISTLEFSNVVFSSTSNLIENGDFESTTEENGTVVPTSWLIEGEKNGVTDDEAWRGEYSGVLELGLGKHTALFQDFILATNETISSCSLHLSGWCSSARAGTKLAAVHNGYRVKEVEINSDGAYSSYGLSFTAMTGSTIGVRFFNDGTLLGGVAKIDNVRLHAKCVAA